MTPLAQGVSTYIQARDLKENALARQFEAMHLVDKLLSLAEMRRLMPVANPEQGGWCIRNTSGLDVPALARGCFTVNGRQLPPPAAGGSVFGLETPLGVYSKRDVLGFYTALRLEQVLTRCRSDLGVVEIGGGMASLAFFSQQLRPKRYRLYDLPTMSVVQAYVLMRSLGEDQVRLWGEGAGTAVEIAPHWALHDDDRPASVFVNQDSLPEINPPDARRYIDTIVAARPEYFLSINQEARAADGMGGRQLVVHDLIRGRPELDLLVRARDWLRKGWVEELYAHRNPRLS
jgi:hypothetical protein